MAAKKKVRTSTAPPVSDTLKRASGVLFAGEEEPSDPAITTAIAPIPQPWLDRLLALTWDAPVHEGDEAVVRAVVDTVSELLPTCGVGACFIASGRQQVIRRHPPEDEQRDKGVDPTRLFPTYAYETILEIPADASGSTLHAASDLPAMLAPESPAVQLLRRAAHVMKRALEHARANQSTVVARRDVTTLNAQMVQAEKLASLGQIAAGMVHELNNPLTSIVAYSDYLTKRWLAKRDHVDADELERLRRIGESAHRLLRFTRDLVTYARPSGDIPIPVVLHGVIDQALVFCEHVLIEAQTQVERRFGDGILPVRGLPEQLTQVFVNLVTNACHAMPPDGGKITIATELVEQDRKVRVTIEDTGSGIPRENLLRIFVPFFTTKSDGRGTGLGLAIVKSIVEAHEGHIHAESEVGRGTRFVIDLPVHHYASSGR